jgi:hypothetical protein
MKNLALSLIVTLVSLTSFGQSYLGQIKQNVNLRKGPGTTYEIITVLKTSSQVFIYSLETEGEFYNVIDISTNEEGYVHKDYVKVIDTIEVDANGVFVKSGDSENTFAEVEITNDSKYKMTLKIDSEKYVFEPYEKKILELNPGKHDLMASAPGIIPYIGTDSVSGQSIYSWKFYIKTTTR